MRTNNNRSTAKHIRYACYLLLLFAVCLLSASCSSEEDIVPELAILTLGVDSEGAETYGIPGTGDENTVECMRILIFNSLTLALEANHYYGTSSSNPMPSLPASLNYTLYTGPKRIIVLGNEPATLSSALDQLTHFSSLQSLTMSEGMTINNTLLPFSTTKELIVNLSGSSVKTKIVLERGVGKIQVQIAKDITSLRTIKLKDIQLINIPSTSRLIDGYPEPSPTLVDRSPDGLSIFDLGLEYKSLNINSPYIYENYAGSPARQTILRVYLTENGMEKSADVPLVCGTDLLGKYIYGVRRNTVSNMQLTVFDEHLKIDYTISDWDKETIWDKELGKKTKNELRIK